MFRALVSGFLISLSCHYAPGQYRSGVDPESESAYLVPLELAVKHFKDNKHEAFDYILEAERRARGHADDCDLLRIQRVKVQIMVALNMIEAARQELERFAEKPICFEKPRDHLSLYNLLGIVYLMRTEFDRSLRYLFEALALAEVQYDTVYLAAVTGNIGTAYYKLSDYEKALRFMLRRHKLDSTVGSINASNLVNISLCYAYLDDFARGDAFLRNAFKLNRFSTDTSFWVNYHYAAGALAFRQAKYSQAQDAFVTSLYLARAQEDGRMILDNLQMLAEVELARNDLEAAHRRLREAEALMTEGIPFHREQLKIYASLAEVHESRRQWREAAKYQRQYINLRDDLYSDVRIANLMDAEAGFVERENRKRIAMQEQLLASQEEALHWQRISNFVLVALALFVAGFLAMIHRDLKRSRQIKHLLEQMVRARTEELQAQQKHTHSALQERELRMKRMLDEIRSVSNSIQGLCAVAVRECREENVKSHLMRIGEQSRIIAQVSSNGDSGLHSLTSNEPG